MCHAARSLPPFFFLAFEFDHAGTRWKVRTEEAGGQAGRQLRAPTEGSGLGYAERGTVPLV